MRDITRVELDLIAQDLEELLGLSLAITKDQAVGAIGLGLPPFIALFTEESFKYLGSPKRQNTENALTTSLFDTYNEVVTKLRARTKLFDDNRGGLEKLNETLVLAHNKSTGWFLSPHRGLLGILKRRFQPDLGIFYFGEHVICTTHTALLTVGLTQEQMLAMDPSNMEEVSRFINEFSVSMGRYLGEVTKYFVEGGYNNEFGPSMRAAEIQLPVTHNDHYGYRVYRYIADSLGFTQTELSASVLFLIAQVNFVQYVLTRLLTPTSALLLRASFLTAYHATRALCVLDRLGGYVAPYQFDRRINSVLCAPDTDFILGARHVRNVLAHYQ